MSTLYNINFRSGKLEPIDASDRNNIPVGTVLRINGYNNPEYVIIKNLGVNEHFPSYGARYQTIGTEDFNYGLHDAHSLEWLKNKSSGKIQIYITDKVLPAEVVADLIAKADQKQVDKEAYQKRAEEERTRLEAIGRERFAKHIPVDAQALIIAECHVDDSDLMSDYHGHTTKETVIIGYSMHKRDIFSEMRKAATCIPETAHLGPGKGHFSPVVVIGQDFQSNGSYYHKGSYSHWHRELFVDPDATRYGQGYVFGTMAEAQAFVDKKGEPFPISFEGQVIPFVWDIQEGKIEHREKYSMGAGYYLKDGHSNSSGWSVSKQVKYRDQWDSGLYVSMGKRCVFEDNKNIPEPPKGKQEHAHTEKAHTKEVHTGTLTHTSDVTITENAEKGGIELRFKSKPESTVLENLKAHGWRWSRFNMCWYHRNVPENMEFARTFTGIPAQGIPDAMPADNAPEGSIPAANAPTPGTLTQSRTAPDMAGKLRALADGMEKAIDGKMNSAISQLNPTRRRMMIAEGMRRDGEQLQKIQFLLRTLADMHETGIVPPELVKITSKAAAHTALFDYRDKMPLAIDIANGKPPENPKAKTLRELDRELIGCKIPGFFITPPKVALQMIELADIREGMEVLEPSAGRGDIAEYVNHGSKLTCIEYQQKLAEILKLRGFDTICGDFLEHTGSYDRIVQNSPFENFQDIQHVRHAYQCLKPGGRLVAIMGEGAFFRQDRIPAEFRAWLEEKGGEVIDLPAGAFQGTITSTGVKARIVVIDKE